MEKGGEHFFGGAHAVLGKADFFEETRAQRRHERFFKKMHELSEQLDAYLEKGQNQIQNKDAVHYEN